LLESGTPFLVRWCSGNNGKKPLFLTSYLTQVSDGFERSCTEAVLFSGEWRIGRPECTIPHDAILRTDAGIEHLMSQRLKILNIVDARPNLPKIASLMYEMLRHSEIEPILVHTGQHYDEKLSDIFLRRVVPKARNC
jgi:hypothetical protein